MIDIKNLGFGSSSNLPSETFLQQSPLMQKFIKNKIERRSKPKKVKPDPRTLSKRELTIAVELTFLTTSLINRLDEMKETSLYDQEVKSASNLLMAGLERYSYTNMWSQIEGEPTGHNVLEQCDLGSQFVDRMLRVTSKVQEFDQGKFEAYVNAIEAVNKEFGLTLLWKGNDPKA